MRGLLDLLCVNDTERVGKGEVMRKFIVFVGGLAIATAAGSAHAGTATANAGLTFTSGGTCTVTGNIANLGNFNSSDNLEVYVAKFGTTEDPVTPTAAPVTLTTVNCTDAMAYTLAIKGTGANNVAKVKRAGPSPADVFDVVPQLTQVNSNNVPKQYIHGDTTENTYFGTGTGRPQVFSGYWAAANPNSSQMALPFGVGSFSAEAIATVNF